MSRNSGRNTDGTFAPGNPGKPKGARHKATQASLALLDGEAEALTRMAVERALEGDVAALRLCLERITPARRDMPVKFDLRPMKNAADAAIAAGDVLEAVSQGELTPDEALKVMGLVDTYRRTLETSDLEARLENLERTSFAAKTKN